MSKPPKDAPLKDYIVTAQVTVSIHTKVRAKSKAEAKRIALDREMQGLCHQCARSEGADEEWRTSGELDGMPVGIAVEDLGGEG